MVRRRTVLIGAGSSAATAIGITALGSDTASANQLSVDGLSVPHEEYESTNAINKARLHINGRYEWATEVTPSKATLRLELNYRGWEQIDAKDIAGTLESEQSNSYELEGNLFNHSEIDPIDLSPENPGDEKTIEFDVRVKLTLRNDGRDIKTMEATDEASVTINKTTAEVTGSIGGEGSFEFGEV